MNCTAEMLRLYAVTDRAWVGRQTLPQQVEAALKGGATCVQLREKHLDDADMLAEAKTISALCRAYHVPFILNDNVPLAKLCGADGVHVGQDDLSAAEAAACWAGPRSSACRPTMWRRPKRLLRTGPTIWAAGPCFPPTPRRTPT